MKSSESFLLPKHWDAGPFKVFSKNKVCLGFKLLKRWCLFSAPKRNERNFLNEQKEYSLLNRGRVKSNKSYCI